MTSGQRWATVLSVMLLGVGCTSGIDTGDIGSQAAGESSMVEVDETSSTTEPAVTSAATTPDETVGSEPVAADGSIDSPPDTEAYISTFDTDRGSDLYGIVAGEVEPVTQLSYQGDPVQLTDIAWSPGGILYGATFGELVRIDPDSGEVSIVASFSADAVNALTFLPDGRLLAADLSGMVLIVDVETARTETIAVYPAGMVSSGDLVVAADGSVYATATDTSVEPPREFLLLIEPDSGTVETVSSSLPMAVYGLVAEVDGSLIGLTAIPVSTECELGEMIRIDPGGDGQVHESIGCLEFTPGGAAGL